MNDYDKLFHEALALSPGSRAMLAEHLLESLDSPTQKEIDSLWAEEAERRVQKVQEGQVQTISTEEVLRRLRAKAK